jgi:hypothetical protein
MAKRVAATVVCNPSFSVATPRKVFDFTDLCRVVACAVVVRLVAKDEFCRIGFRLQHMQVAGSKCETIVAH